jgi:hypothetical protein
MLILALSASFASATELPSLLLDDGANRVALTLVNRSNSDLSAVSASVDRSELLAWLSVQCMPRSVNAPRGAQSQGKLFLDFTVQNAPAGAKADVPLVLRDALGKTWSYMITVQANTSRPLPDALIGNYPNPFNPDTVISFSLASSRRASLVVYNTLGQKVRTIADGPLAAGKHTVIWDGCDDAGRAVSNGVYFARMESGTYRNTIKMLFAR